VNWAEGTVARRLAGGLLVLVAFSVFGAQSASNTRPGPGRHAALLCVATGASAAPSCGPAQVDVGSNGAVRVRVDDVVYHLQLRSSQVEVVLMHGAVQIDEFTAPYQWVGTSLQFNDDDRKSRYEIRFPERKHSTR
jgi:hypothetical protein